MLKIYFKLYKTNNINIINMNYIIISTCSALIGEFITLPINIIRI
jgi:hypothetical protein